MKGNKKNKCVVEFALGNEGVTYLIHGTFIVLNSRITYIFVVYT